jgi:hypothetical protein
LRQPRCSCDVAASHARVRGHAGHAGGHVQRAARAEGGGGGAGGAPAPGGPHHHSRQHQSNGRPGPPAARRRHYARPLQPLNPPRAAERPPPPPRHPGRRFSPSWACPCVPCRGCCAPPRGGTTTTATWPRRCPAASCRPAGTSWGEGGEGVWARGHVATNHAHAHDAHPRPHAHPHQSRTHHLPPAPRPAPPRNSRPCGGSGGRRGAPTPRPPWRRTAPTARRRGVRGPR